MYALTVRLSRVPSVGEQGRELDQAAVELAPELGDLLGGLGDPLLLPAVGDRVSIASRVVGVAISTRWPIASSSSVGSVSSAAPSSDSPGRNMTTMSGVVSSRAQ